MIKLFFISLIIFISYNALAADRLDLVFNVTEARQGALIKGKLLIQPGSINLPVQKLKGSTVGETIYFQQLSAPLKKDGSPNFESDIKVIFVKVPESESIPGMLGQNEIVIQAGGLRIIPVEAPGQMLWADFTAPDFLTRNWKWLWIGLIFILLASASFIVGRKLLRKKNEKLRRKNLAQEFRSSKTYDDVVEMWKRKRNYLEEFPHIEDSFRKFEEVLFRYQFKPHQTDAEKETVVAAYRKLLDESEGGFRGI